MRIGRVQIIDERKASAKSNPSLEQDVKRLQLSVDRLYSVLKNASDKLREVCSKRENRFVWLATCRVLREDLTKVTERLRDCNQDTAIAVDMFERNLRFKIGKEAAAAAAAPTASPAAGAVAFAGGSEARAPMWGGEIPVADPRLKRALETMRSFANVRVEDEEERKDEEEAKSALLSEITGGGSVDGPAPHVQARIDRELMEHRERVSATKALVDEAHHLCELETLLLDLYDICNIRRFEERKLKAEEAKWAALMRPAEEKERYQQNLLKTKQTRVQEAEKKLADQTLVGQARKFVEDDLRDLQADVAKVKADLESATRTSNELRARCEEALAGSSLALDAIRQDLVQRVQFIWRADRRVGGALDLNRDMEFFDNATETALERVTRRREQLQYSFWSLVISAAPRSDAAAALASAPSGGKAAQPSLDANMQAQRDSMDKLLLQQMREVREMLEAVKARSDSADSPSPMSASYQI